jgi:hypothetical protein
MVSVAEEFVILPIIKGEEMTILYDWLVIVVRVLVGPCDIDFITRILP